MSKLMQLYCQFCFALHCNHQVSLQNNPLQWCFTCLLYDKTLKTWGFRQQTKYYSAKYILQAVNLVFQCACIVNNVLRAVNLAFQCTCSVSDSTSQFWLTSQPWSWIILMSSKHQSNQFLTLSNQWLIKGQKVIKIVAKSKFDMCCENIPW